MIITLIVIVKLIVSYNNLKIIEMHSEEDPSLIRTLKGHKESIMTLDLHPTCRYVASAGMDNIILLWDLTKQAPPNKLLGHKVLLS